MSALARFRLTPRDVYFLAVLGFIAGNLIGIQIAVG
jgi:hypothetical protein